MAEQDAGGQHLSGAVVIDLSNRESGAAAEVSGWTIDRWSVRIEPIKVAPSALELPHAMSLGNVI